MWNSDAGKSCSKNGAVGTCQATSTGGVGCVTRATTTCAKGEAYDDLAGKCVPVSCEAASACPAGQVCQRVDVQCIRAPCPQFSCSGGACDADARECPDGSYVGRTGPNCAFAPCPNENKCRQGEEYDTATNKCVAVSCDAASACPAGKACRATPGVQCFRAPCPQFSCEDDNVICTADARECPDGSYVGRTGPDCAFAPCPGEKQCGRGQEYDSASKKCVAVSCDATNACPAGQTCRIADVDCVRAPCPQFTCVNNNACTKELKICPDGTGVGRTGPNCEFAPCPDDVACTDDARQCPDGSWVGRSGPNCEFVCPEDPKCEKGEEFDKLTKQCVAVSCEAKPCRVGSQCVPSKRVCVRAPCAQYTCESQGCPEDLRECPDGSHVARDPATCEFRECPVACTLEAKVCKDGSTVGRVGPKCEFAPCPDEIVECDGSNERAACKLPTGEPGVCGWESPKCEEGRACPAVVQPVCTSCQINCPAVVVQCDADEEPYTPPCGCQGCRRLIVQEPTDTSAQQVAVSAVALVAATVAAMM